MRSSQILCVPHGSIQADTGVSEGGKGIYYGLRKGVTKGHDGPGES
jgi:hypothetical protein